MFTLLIIFQLLENNTYDLNHFFLISISISELLNTYASKTRDKKDRKNESDVYEKQFNVLKLKKFLYFLSYITKNDNNNYDKSNKNKINRYTSKNLSSDNKLYYEKYGNRSLFRVS